MRKFLTLTLAAGVLLFVGTAQAGTLTSATFVGSFQGTPFTMAFGGGPSPDGTLTASGTSGAATASVSLTALVTPILTNLNTTGVAPVYISQTLGGSQTIAIGPGAVANQGIAGNVNVRIGIDSTGLLLFPVALSVGVAGTFTTTAVVPGFNFPVSVTATFFPWNTGVTTVGGGSLFATTTTVSGATNMTVALPDAMFTGSVNLTAGGAGTITLVAPTVTHVCVGPGFSGFPCLDATPTNVQANKTASATTLTLNFTNVPEPGTLLLLGAGLAGLAAVGRRQRS